MLKLVIFTLLIGTGTLHLSYILYALFSKSKKKTKKCKKEFTIQHVVCFHNESAFIERKLENCYNLNFPGIYHTFVDDNSTDNTMELLKKYQKGNTIILNNKTNKGKNQSQIKAVNKFDSDLLLFTDANVFLEEDSLTKLVKYFDENTGGVTGNVLIKTAIDEVEFSGRYWNLEKRIKKFQTISGSVIGFDGGFYCVKRENYNVKRENELSDFETAFLILEQQQETRYANDARAVEIEKRSLKSSFKARMRASNRVFWSYGRIFKYIKRLKKKVILHFVLHKILRYSFIIFFVLLIPSMLFYCIINSPWLLIFIFIPYVFRFFLESIALFVGGIIALSGKEFTTWSDKKV